MRAHRSFRSSASSPAPTYERVLLALGVDPTFAQSVLGDLTEEYALRVECDGVGAARCWYAAEAVRSAPYLARNALRQLRVRRVLMATSVAGAAVTFAVAALGPRASAAPARLAVGIRDTVLINHVRPFALAATVFDSTGHALSDSGVRFASLDSGAIPVSPRGVVTCVRRADVVVRASLGPLSTHSVVLCRPVQTVRTQIWNDFVLGDATRELPAEFTGVSGERVTLLRVRMSVRDSTVAALSGLHIRPLRPGRTQLNLKVGDRTAEAAIRVFDPVRSLEGLNPLQHHQQRLVAATVQLARGESVRWPLPQGIFALVLLPALHADPSADMSALMLSVNGPVVCVPTPRPGVSSMRCLARAPGATVTVANSNMKPKSVLGYLALEWESQR